METTGHIPAYENNGNDATLQVGYDRPNQLVEVRCDAPFPITLTAQQCEVLEVALRVARQSIRKS